MSLACITLTILVTMPPPPKVVHEWHHHTFCEQGMLTDRERAGTRRTSCEEAAHYYIESLQFKGTLPGSRDVISYSVTCTTEI